MKRSATTGYDARVILALAAANARYWTAVAPHVRRHLRRWQQHADAIPDPTLRAHALAKLRDEHFNAQVAATLATLAPRRHRSDVITAIVAFQVMYDYLDALSEQPVADPLRNGHQLFRAFAVALTPDAPAPDYYRHHPQHRDGGYLDALVATCRATLAALPAARAVAPIARRAALACGESQTRTHAIPHHGTGPLRAWARARATDTGLTWWEFAAGAAASSLTVHALLAAAADPATTGQDAARIGTAYVSISALSTLLDSLVDHEQDTRDGSHRYLSYYADAAAATEGIAAVACAATLAARTLPRAPHHTMTVAGVAGYYLTAPNATGALARPVRERVLHELQPTIAPVLAIFGLWRAAKGMRRRPTGSLPYRGTRYETRHV